MNSCCLAHTDVSIRTNTESLHRMLVRTCGAPSTWYKCGHLHPETCSHTIGRGSAASTQLRPLNLTWVGLCRFSTWPDCRTSSTVITRQWVLRYLDHVSLAHADMFQAMSILAFCYRRLQDPLARLVHSPSAVRSIPGRTSQLLAVDVP